MTDHAVSPIAAAPRQEVSSTFRQIAVLAALAATGTLATNILLPSLPQMAVSLRVTTAEVTASITVFLAVFAIGQLAVGPISDRYGRRWPVLTGFAVFFAGSVWCGLADDLPACWLAAPSRPPAPVPPPCYRAPLPATCSAARRWAARWH